MICLKLSINDSYGIIYVRQEFFNLALFYQFKGGFPFFFSINNDGNGVRAHVVFPGGHISKKLLLRERMCSGPIVVFRDFKYFLGQLTVGLDVKNGIFKPHFAFGF